MRVRAAALLIQNGLVAVMERHRSGRHYFTFPGGGVDSGETAEQAVIREVMEELGLKVRVIRRVALVWFEGNRQEHFLVEVIGGRFGTGKGLEYSDHHRESHGTYHPMWMPILTIPDHIVLPKGIADLVVRSATEGWPEDPVELSEPRK